MFCKITLYEITMKYLKILAISGILLFSSCSKKQSNNPQQNSAANKGKGLGSQISDTALSNQKITKIDLNGNGAVPKPVTFNDKFSYLQGLEMGAQLKMAEIKPNPDFFALGLTHGFEGNDKFLSKTEMEAMTNEVGKIYKDKMNVMVEKKKKEFAALGVKYKKEAEEFFKKNKSMPDVKTSPSGLQYKVVKEGSGTTASIGDVCNIYLKGTMLDGTVFEDTFGKQAMPVQVDKSIMPAWREALMMMKPGSRYIIYAPSDLAFGSKGQFPTIPPNAAMIFEIELVENRGKISQK
jgi:FKBP-type peptidyl-prolyl cis-trans isomerase